MATSSIYENIKIRDPKTAEAFIHAIEASENAPKFEYNQDYHSRMGTPEDSIRLYKLRKQKRELNRNESHR